MGKKIKEGKEKKKGMNIKWKIEEKRNVGGREIR
jgi:hypothetical protein